MSGSLETNGGTQWTSCGDLHPIPPPSAQWRLKNVFSNGASIAATRSAVYRRSPIQRRFRDIHVVTQHMMLNQNATLDAVRTIR